MLPNSVVIDRTVPGIPGKAVTTYLSPDKDHREQLKNLAPKNHEPQEPLGNLEEEEEK